MMNRDKLKYKNKRAKGKMIMKDMLQNLHDTKKPNVYMKQLTKIC